jgi:hypothetical protein
MSSTALDESLREVFLRYCAFGSSSASSASELDSAKLMKLCRVRYERLAHVVRKYTDDLCICSFHVVQDCGLISRDLKQQDVDLIFTRVKRPGARKITYTEFKVDNSNIHNKC